MNIEQGKYYLQWQENNPDLGEILEMFHFRSEDEEGMTNAQVSYFIYDEGLSWDDAYYSNYNFEDKCVEIPKFFWDDWLKTLFVIKRHVASFLRPNGVSKEDVDNGVVMYAVGIEDEDSPFLYIDENTYHFGDSVKEIRNNFDDFEEIAVCVDRETVDVSIGLANRMKNEVKEQMKKVFNAPQGKCIPHVYIDWDYNEDEKHNHKFTIPKEAHKFVSREKVVIHAHVAPEEKIQGIVIDCQDDGLVIHTDESIDIFDDYSIEVTKE